MSAVRRIPRSERPEGTSYVVVDFNVVNGFGLTDGEKIIFSLIHNLSNRKEGCTATNDYFAKILEKYNPFEADPEKLLVDKCRAEKAISASISRLTKKGAITVKLLKTKNGTKRFIFSNVRIVKPTPQNIDPDPQNVEDPPQKVEWVPQNIECMHSTNCGPDIKEDSKIDNKEKEKENKNETHSSELNYAQIYSRVQELFIQQEVEYAEHFVKRENFVINEFMFEGISATKIFETVRRLVAIKKSKELKDAKFWERVPYSIASAKSYYSQIHTTFKTIKKEIPTERPKSTKHPGDFEYFEDWLQSVEQLGRSAIEELLRAESPEEYSDPNTKNKKAELGKTFFEVFKKSKLEKGEPCKFKKPKVA
ncbi:hypothetical protein EHR03_13025 [Leptospira mayottensis]|uniref:Uncharacterized protein n=1 Tax=Leptospira mayottensis 200901116 TaxID=1192864 RepID=M6UZV5_9LEPT|nr:hypothetical protein [Leptospira mayottensis]AVH81588.1 hypothetical protein [Leptospira mayottensis 200901116]TGN00347.1 hypothetical protein EHR03_13025 [Leptospira mayottensis]